MTTNETASATVGYEAPAVVVLGPAEDLTQETTKTGSGADATSAFHMSV